MVGGRGVQLLMSGSAADSAVEHTRLYSSASVAYITPCAGAVVEGHQQRWHRIRCSSTQYT